MKKWMPRHRIIIALHQSVHFTLLNLHSMLSASELKFILLRKTSTIIGMRKLWCYRKRLVEFQSFSWKLYLFMGPQICISCLCKSKLNYCFGIKTHCFHQRWKTYIYWFSGLSVCSLWPTSCLFDLRCFPLSKEWQIYIHVQVIQCVINFVLSVRTVSKIWFLVSSITNQGYSVHVLPYTQSVLIKKRYSHNLAEIWLFTVDGERIR